MPSCGWCNPIVPKDMSIVKSIKIVLNFLGGWKTNTCLNARAGGMCLSRANTWKIKSFGHCIT